MVFQLKKDIVKTSNHKIVLLPAVIFWHPALCASFYHLFWHHSSLINAGSEREFICLTEHCLRG